MERRQYDAHDLDAPVVCPAGERIAERLEGPACRCRIESSVITAARDGSSLAVYCQGDFKLCPTWRLARETEWRHQTPETLTVPTGLSRNFTLDDAAEVGERLEAGDIAGAEAIRARIDESRRAQGLRDPDRE